MTTAAADAMARVVTAIAPMLTQRGFRKRRHRFNRTPDADIVQVVQFQMGPFPPPGYRGVPDVTTNLYGWFTVNLGVYVAGLKRRHDEPKGDWVDESYCHYRSRLGHVMPQRTDVWWALSDIEVATGAVARGLSEFGLPWLDRFHTERL